MEVGRRQRNQPAPPQVIFDALTKPHHDPGREWLKLGDDEAEPVVLEVDEPHLVVWSSLWPARSDARIRFDLPFDAGKQGTDLLWTLEVDEPEPEAPLLGHMRKRLNVLINAELRYSFGQ